MWSTVAFLLWSTHPAQAFPVFTFSDTFYPKAQPSFALLTRNIELPTTFILCISIKEKRITDRGFFQVLGEDGNKWMKLAFYEWLGAVSLWLEWDNGWYKLQTFDTLMFGYWHHICLEIHLHRKEVKAAVNGEMGESIVGEHVTNWPSKLNMAVGKSEKWNSVEMQFEGAVTNIQVFTLSTDNNIASLSLKPCKIKGDILGWQVGNWRVGGGRWLVVEEREDSVCEQGAGIL